MMLRLAFLVLLGTSCSGSDSTNPPQCNGASCTCPAGETCGFSQSDCGASSCSLDCSQMNVCEGSCAESCSIDCGGRSTCTPTLGPSGSISCGGGSTCHVTCTGSCSLSCSPDSTCDLRCAGETSARPVPQGGSCK